MLQDKLFPFFNEDGGAEGTGVEGASAAGEQQIEGTANQTGVEGQAVAEPEKQNNFEKAFAKRLAEKEAQWKTEKDAELSKIKEQYKDYDDVKSVADYFRELNQAPDMMTMKERIEMERLQQRAEQENVPVEVLKRLNELEAKAAEGDKLKQQQEEQDRTRREQEETQKAYQEFRGKLDTFAKEKGQDADQLYAFMVENQIGNMDAALKAMQYDDLAKERAEAEKTGMKKLLQAKGSIPNVVGNKQTGQVSTGPAKTWAEARQRAMSRDYNPA